jgi:hypothetical protein
MTKKGASARVSLLLLILGLLAAGSAFAGSLIVGSVVGATNASLGGQALVAGNTIFSGDDLEVRDGAAVVTLGRGSRMVFGKDSVASFVRNASDVTALLSKGSVSVYHPAEDQALLRLRIGNLSVVPGKGFKTLGEVAMTSDTLMVTTKEGLLRVEGSGKTTEIPKGQWAKFIPTVSRSPQQAGGAQTYGGGGSSAVMWIAVAAGGTAAVLAGLAMSRASDAKDASNAATAAANTADTDAKAAAAAATTANQNAIAAGCALNKLAPANTTPFTPVGATCP